MLLAPKTASRGYRCFFGFHEPQFASIGQVGPLRVLVSQLLDQWEFALIDWEENARASGRFLFCPNTLRMRLRHLAPPGGNGCARNNVNVQTPPPPLWPALLVVWLIG